MRTIENLDFKIQFLKEWLDNGGYQKIWDIGLLEELKNVKCDINGKVKPETIGSRTRAFMNVLLLNQSLPPLHIDEYITEYESFVQKRNFFEQKQIETEEQVDELFEKYKGTMNILFRGQSEAK